MQPPNPTNDENDDEEEEVRTLVVRAIDGEWVMGEDVILPVTGDETIVEVQQARRDTARISGGRQGSSNRARSSCLMGYMGIRVSPPFAEKLEMGDQEERTQAAVLHGPNLSCPSTIADTDWVHKCTPESNLEVHQLFGCPSLNTCCCRMIQLCVHR